MDIPYIYSHLPPRNISVNKHNKMCARYILLLFVNISKTHLTWLNCFLLSVFLSFVPRIRLRMLECCYGRAVLANWIQMAYPHLSLVILIELSKSFYWLFREMLFSVIVVNGHRFSINNIGVISRNGLKLGVLKDNTLLCGKSWEFLMEMV